MAQDRFATWHTIWAHKLTLPTVDLNHELHLYHGTLAQLQPRPPEAVDAMLRAILHERGSD